MDSAVKSDDMHKPVGLWPCHNQGGNQVSVFCVVPCGETNCVGVFKDS